MCCLCDGCKNHDQKNGQQHPVCTSTGSVRRKCKEPLVCGVAVGIGSGCYRFSVAYCPLCGVTVLKKLLAELLLSYYS